MSIGHLQNELVIEKLCFHYTMLLTILFIIKLFAQSNIFTNKSLSKIQIFNVHKIKQFMSKCESNKFFATNICQTQN